MGPFVALLGKDTNAEGEIILGPVAQLGESAWLRPSFSEGRDQEVGGSNPSGPAYLGRQ